MARPRDNRQADLLLARLDQIINLKHPLVLLVDKIDQPHGIPACHPSPSACTSRDRRFAVRTRTSGVITFATVLARCWRSAMVAARP
jgi:hypothetical protein